MATGGSALNAKPAGSVERRRMMYVFSVIKHIYAFYGKLYLPICVLSYALSIFCCLVNLTAPSREGQKSDFDVIVLSAIRRGKTCSSSPLYYVDVSVRLQSYLLLSEGLSSCYRVVHFWVRDIDSSSIVIWIKRISGWNVMIIPSIYICQLQYLFIFLPASGDPWDRQLFSCHCSWIFRYWVAMMSATIAHIL